MPIIETVKQNRIQANLFASRENVKQNYNNSLKELFLKYENYYNGNNEIEQIKFTYENKLNELTQEINNYKNEINKLVSTINHLEQDIQNKNETISQLLKHNEMNSIKLTNLETQINDFIKSEHNNSQLNSIQSNNNNNQSDTNNNNSLKNLNYIDNIISSLNESLNQIIPPLSSKVPYYKLDNLKSLNLPSSSHQRSLTENNVALKEKKNENFPQCVLDNSCLLHKRIIHRRG